MDPFVAVFRGRTGHVPVHLTRRAGRPWEGRDGGGHGVVSLAAAVGRTLGLRAGIVNPSDVVALRTGSMGMLWDSGDVALEEVLFTQLLLCIHHRDLNGELYDAKRTVVSRREPHAPLCRSCVRCPR
jgi:hypothetical protein